MEIEGEKIIQLSGADIEKFCSESAYREWGHKREERGVKSAPASAGKTCQNPFCCLQGPESQARANGADALSYGSLPRKVVLELRLSQDPTAHQDDPEESHGAAEGEG